MRPSTSSTRRGPPSEALGIRNGPSYTQLRLGPDGPVVMEVAARLGGGHDAELCRVATGVDLNALAVAAALGERDACASLLRASPAPREGAAVVFLVPPEGTLTAVEGWRRRRRSTGSSGCGSTAARGTSSARSGGARTGRVRCSRQGPTGTTRSSALAVRR